jgi:orotate phosphoribosyltransferase
MAATALAIHPSVRDRLHQLIATRSLRKDREFTLSSGRTSNYFFDIKKTVLHPEGGNLIADAVLQRLQGEDVQAIGGLVQGAVPIVSIVSAKSFQTGQHILGFFVRKEPKGYGTNQVIEGCLE